MVICEAIQQRLQHRDSSGSILACAPSDHSADNLALRLKPWFSKKEILRLNSHLRPLHEVPDELLDICFIENSHFFGLPDFRSLMGFKLVITTCVDADILVQARVSNRDLISLQQQLKAVISPRDYRISAFEQYSLHWTALFLDDGAGATELEALIRLSIIAPPSRPSNCDFPIFVLAGDQYQLRPRLLGQAKSQGISVFERLLTLPIYASRGVSRQIQRRVIKTNTQTLAPPVGTLTRNYRSHPAILAVSSAFFYDNSLIAAATDVHSLEYLSCWLGNK